MCARYTITVVHCLVDGVLSKFDASLRHSLELIASSILDSSWIQATLPVRDGSLSLYETLIGLICSNICN